MIRRPPRSTQSRSSAASDVYKRQQVHEVVHHWWGNQVTPRDWRDLWMSEGMTMYLQLLWEDEHGLDPLEERLADIAADAPAMCRQAGPPASYDAEKFAERNV